MPIGRNTVPMRTALPILSDRPVMVLLVLRLNPIQSASSQIRIAIAPHSSHCHRSGNRDLALTFMLIFFYPFWSDCLDVLKNYLARLRNYF
ncbi:hypothetical protein [Tolypothrix sp. VBCCA 56010]|uniref:hypothetical protein n=1 Tax=Tolypothrix sp. VBCCA 56010 TaxID=3137731 RepID=UPI003D7D512D